MTTEVKEFFAGYEKAIAQSDIPALAALYADVFMFGGPSGVRSVKKDDFVKVLPRRKEQFASLGLTDSRVVHVESIELDSKYLLAKTRWVMSLLRSGAKQEFETSASYVLQRTRNALTIIMQIDHQDLGARLQELGGENDCPMV